MIPIPVAASPAPLAASALPACAAGQLALSFDDGDGAFDGMSHAGTLMVLRNTGPTACRVPALPRLSFIGPDGTVLPIAFRAPAGMHPGPAVPPVGIVPGGAVTAALLWVSQDVDEPGRCFAPARVAVAFGAVSLAQPFSGRVCGPRDAAATYQQQWLRPDTRAQK